MSSGAEPDYLPLIHPRHGLQRRLRLLNHLVPAVLLVQGAVHAFRSGDPEIVRVLEFLAGAAYVIVAVQHWRHLAHHPHAVPSTPDWLEVVVACIAALEGFHLWHQHHLSELAGAPHRVHILPFLYLALALLYLILAFCAAKLHRRQGLNATADGFKMRLLPISRARTVRWADLASIQTVPGAHDLWLQPATGASPTLLKLQRYHNAQEISEWICRRALQTGVPWTLYAASTGPIVYDSKSNLSK